MNLPRVEIDPKGLRFVDADGKIVREYSTPAPYPQHNWNFFRTCDCCDEDYHHLRQQRDDLLLQVDQLHTRLSQVEGKS